MDLLQRTFPVLLSEKFLFSLFVFLTTTLYSNFLTSTNVILKTAAFQGQLRVSGTLYHAQFVRFDLYLHLKVVWKLIYLISSESVLSSHNDVYHVWFFLIILLFIFHCVNWSARRAWFSFLLLLRNINRVLLNH